MKATSRQIALVSILLCAGLAGATQAWAKVGYYPDTRKPSFLVDYPDDWELAPAEGEDDYVNMSAPTGAALVFRTIPGSEDAMKEAIEDSVAYIKENYGKVSFKEPVKAAQSGLMGFFMDGSGSNKEGEAIVFRMAWLTLKDGKIGEIWFVANADDKAGIAAASKVMNSFRAP